MPRQHATYLRQMVLVAGTVALVVIAFNVLLDSYRIFGTPTISGVNAVKHGVDRHARIAKAYAVRNLQPQLVLLGTSRAESTLDPEHDLFRGFRTYNLAFPGASFYEQLRYLQHATFGGQLQMAVVALDFFQFTGDKQWVSGEFDEGRLTVNADGLANPYPWRDVVNLTISGSAFKDSWWSIRRQRSKPSIYRQDGYRDDSNDIPEMLSKPGGQHWEFVASEKLYVKNYTRNHQLIANARQVPHTAYDDLKAIIAWSESRNIKLMFLIPPVHARHLELIHQLGIWPEFESWQRRIVSILGIARQPDWCLWNFTGFNAITAESVPREPNGQMHWWRESSHATRATGKAMLDRIQAGPSGRAPSGFGRCLTLGNFENFMADLRAEHATWIASHPEDAAEVAAIARTETAKGLSQ